MRADSTYQPSDEAHCEGAAGQAQGGTIPALMAPGFTDRDAVLNPPALRGVWRKNYSASMQGRVRGRCHQLKSSVSLLNAHHECEKHADTYHDVIPDGRVKDMKPVKIRRHYEWQGNR